MASSCHDRKHKRETTMSTAVNITIARSSSWETEEKKHNHHQICMWPDDMPKHPHGAAFQTEMLTLVRAILGDEAAMLSRDTVHRAQKAFLEAQQQQQQLTGSAQASGTTGSLLRGNQQGESKQDDNSSSERAGDPDESETIHLLNEKLRQQEKTIETLKSQLEDKEDLLLEKDKRIHQLTDQIAGKFLERNAVRKPSSSSRLEEIRNKIQRKKEVLRKKIDTVWNEAESSRCSLEVEIEKRKEQLTNADKIVQVLREEVVLWKEKASLVEDEVKSSGNVAETKELEEKLAEALENLKKTEEDKDAMEKGYQEFLDDTLQCLKKSEAEVEELASQVEAAVCFGGSFATIDGDIAVDMDEIEKRLSVTSSKLSRAKWLRKIQKNDRQMVRAASELMLEAGQCIAILREGENMAAHDAIAAREVVEGDLNLYKKLLSLSNAKLEKANRKLKKLGQGIVFVEAGRAGQEESELSVSIHKDDCFSIHRVDI